MKFVRGIALPDADTHFAAHLEASPLVDGKPTYQLKKLEYALSLCTSWRHAVDVGAHVGLWSRVLATKFEKITAFEPVTEHYRCAEVNLADRPNVTLRGFALGDAEGTVHMSPAAENSGNAHVKDDGPIKVPVRTLDSFGLMVDFLKIDVEGFEWFVVAGGRHTIMANRPIMVVEQKPGNAERYGHARTAAVELLRSWGAIVHAEMSGDFILGWP